MPAETVPAPFVHEIRVRYGECDQQGVVFNAHYMAYVDDAIDLWFAHVFEGGYLGEFDFMVKKATIEWASSARHLETLALRPSVTRWGNTSFDVSVAGFVGERPVFEATLIYISVTPGTATPCPIPARVREALA